MFLKTRILFTSFFSFAPHTIGYQVLSLPSQKCHLPSLIIPTAHTNPHALSLLLWSPHEHVGLLSLSHSPLQLKPSSDHASPLPKTLMILSLSIKSSVTWHHLFLLSLSFCLSACPLTPATENPLFCLLGIPSQENQTFRPPISNTLLL